MIAVGEAVILPMDQANKLRRLWYGNRACMARTESAVALMTEPARVLDLYRERLRWGRDDVASAYRRRRRQRRPRPICGCRHCRRSPVDALMASFLRRWALLNPAFVPETRA